MPFEGGRKTLLNVAVEKVDENGLPVETPLASNKPFMRKGKRLDYNHPVINEDEDEDKPESPLEKKKKKKSAQTNTIKSETCFIESNMIALLILYRLVNCYIVRTWFAPDEYWQSQEVAHYLAFNYGYLTWEWKVGIRSYIYPAFLSIGYKILEILSLDETFLLNLLSPLLHSLLAALADYVFYNYVKRTYNSDIAYKATVCRLMSWYTFFISPRSLTNNIEEILTIFILASFPTKNNASYYGFHALSFLSFAIRATAAINLIPIYFYFFFKTKFKTRFIREFIVTGLVAMQVYCFSQFTFHFRLIIMTLNTLLDSYLHGSFLLTSLNFFVYNVYQNIGTHYGTHVWYWYLISGLPTVLLTHVILFVVGVIYIDRLLPIAGISFNIFVYSLLSHKEFRFLSQIMPYLMIICAYGLKHIKENFGDKVYKFTFKFVASTNIILALIVSLLHQRAPIAVMEHLKSNANLSTNDSVLFLTPCHSTPYYSYLHKNIKMSFLTCEPNLSQIENYTDEADLFFANPYDWLNKNEQLVNEATYIVLFENLYNDLLLANREIADTAKLFNKFYACNKFFYSFTKQTQNTDKKLLLLCLRKQKQFKI